MINVRVGVSICHALVDQDLDALVGAFSYGRFGEASRSQVLNFVLRKQRSHVSVEEFTSDVGAELYGFVFKRMRVFDQPLFQCVAHCRTSFVRYGIDPHVSRERVNNE